MLPKRAEASTHLADQVEVGVFLSHVNQPQHRGADRTQRGLRAGLSGDHRCLLAGLAAVHKLGQLLGCQAAAAARVCDLQHNRKAAAADLRKRVGRAGGLERRVRFEQSAGDASGCER